MPNRAASALRRYRARRNFRKTPEPAGVKRRSARELEFVVQRHHARRLHYDFRLEWDGVLKSWAVPKGPSLDPAEKRLAVAVEDHPFEYRKFSGDIPAGEYGAGHVMIWDRGTWVPNGDVRRGLAAGKLDFTLHGERLQGAWSLVRLKQEAGSKTNWLLIKQRDLHATRGSGPEITGLHTDPVADGKRARPARKPRIEFIPPQLATPVASVPRGGRWLTELKFDGYRIVSYVDRARVHCYTRSGKDWTHKMPAVAAALARLGLHDSWLDGELVAVDDHGMPQFQRLQQALDTASGEAPQLMVFDVLRLAGADLRSKPQLERKRLLQQALATLEHGAPVRLVDFVDGASLVLSKQACAQGFEGVILKDAEAVYRSGRNRAWIKLKCRREQEFVIGGYTRTAAGRRTLTSLLLGVYDDHGALHFAGRAGTGFSAEQLDSLRRRLDALGQPTSPFTGNPALRRIERPYWVRPELVAQVRFSEWTQSGILRQPLFLGLREDVSVRNVRREPDMTIAASKTPKRGRTRPEQASVVRRRSAKARAIAASPQPGQVSTLNLKLTHPQRVLFPADGVTKLQLAEYYDAVAPVLWPHLRARPLSLVRATNNQGRVFFQRHINGDAVPGLRAVEIPGSDEKPYFVCASQDSVPQLAQLGAVELHTWGSRMPRPERADRITFDLDPDPALPWPRVREAATLLRGMLDELGLAARLKTSGGLGLHVVVPLTQAAPFEAAAAFSRRVAEHLARLIPERFSAKRGAPNRKGRVYVDWQRNQFAATTVAAYSPRRRPGVPVSLPIDWDELDARDIRRAHFNLRNVAARVAERGDAWDSQPPIRQSLTRRVIDRLESAAAR